MKKKYTVKGTAEKDSLHRGNAGSTFKGPFSGRNGFVIFGSSQHGLDDLTFVEQIRSHNKHTPIIMIAGDTTDKQVTAALDIGLTDFIGISVQPDQVVNRLKKKRVNPDSDAEYHEPVRAPFIVGDSPVMKDIKAELGSIAATDCNVLLTGETGTGKDLAAEYIHLMSRRKDQSLVCINCTAFPETLLESELFGYEKGAFTNAETSRVGKFESASGSTLFLDEIGDMGQGAQAKILRAIEKKEIWRIGGARPFKADFRLVTATNRDLEDMIDRGTFREDLYYRLNIARVHIPPLRERKEDIPALAHYACHVFNRKFGLEVHDIGDEVMDLFLGYDWPGNIRQLNNVIEASFIHHPRDVLAMEDLPDFFTNRRKAHSPKRPNEANRITQALLETGNNKAEAARKLNMSRMTLYRKMARHKISLS